MDQKISLYMAYHKEAFVPEGYKTLVPIQVGRALSEVKLPMIGDDTGDNISDKEDYAEIRALYWAWKNDKTSDYLGFFHYRRVLDFSKKISLNSSSFFYEEAAKFNRDTLEKYYPHDALIDEAVKEYDITLPTPFYLKTFDSSVKTVQEQFEKWHGEQDYILSLKIIKEQHPDYVEDFEALSKADYLCLFSMFVARRDIFERYCEWLFPILAELEAKRYNENVYPLDNFLHLTYIAERLLNVFFKHEQRVNPQLKIGYRRVVFFKNTTPEPCEPPLPITDLPIRTVVMAVSPSYPPYTAAAIASLFSNVSKDVFIDLIILHRGVKEDDKRRLKNLEKLHPHALISLVNIGEKYEELEAGIQLKHLDKTTFYRLKILDPDFLKLRDEVLYLDSDLIVVGDINEIFTTDLKDKQIAAVSDLVMQCMLIRKDKTPPFNGKSWFFKDYIQNFLGIEKTEEYFNAGVLLFDLKKINKINVYKNITNELLATNFIIDDQDALNKIFKGKVKYLPYSHNVPFPASKQHYELIWGKMPLHLWEFCPDLAKKPFIVHYAGDKKPWNTPNYKFLPEYFWRYLRMTDFYEEVLIGMMRIVSAPEQQSIVHYKRSFIYRAARKAARIFWQKTPWRLKNILRPVVRPVVRLAVNHL